MVEEDHFAHSILPPRPPSKRPLQVVLIVIILAATTALAIYYWPMLSAFFTSLTPAPAVTQVAEEPQKPVTIEQKQALYKQAAVTDTGASSTPLSNAQKQQLLQNAANQSSAHSGSSTGKPAPVQSTLTAEEKQRLLQSAH